ncbi:MAG: outer membrane beta-barrel protein [Acidobacteria bacterium]|nr:outer membrane beta-barrel protein [Acidobacteriota bacterium]
MSFPFGPRFALLVACLALSLGLSAQSSTSPGQPKPAPGAQSTAPQAPVAIKELPPAQAPPPGLVDSGAYIRRFTFGGTLSWLPLSLIQGGKKSETYGTPPISIESQADNKSKYFGVGATMDAYILERYSINLSLIWRRAGYHLTTKLHDTVDDPGTSTDERTLMMTVTEDTRADYYDLPLLVRRYSKSRFEGGWRYFYEAGGTARVVRNIRSQTQVDTADYSTCCSEVPATPSSKSAFGASAGAGVMLKDDFGIKIIPGVRYTYWFGGIFNERAAVSRRHQVDVGVSFVF